MSAIHSWISETYSYWIPTRSSMQLCLLGGISGAILTGVFAVETIGGTPGAIEGNFSQILTQIYGVGVTIAWCAVVSFVLLKIIGAVIGLSASEDDQREGLDVAFHGERVS